MKSVHRVASKPKKTQYPLVSIVMPVYNASAFMRAAIDSILNQTYTHFELVIVDDQSLDNSWSIAKEYAASHPDRIRAIRLKKNTNAAGNGAMNAVYPKLKGAFIARMDADDIAYPARIGKQVRFMQSHPDAVVVGTQGTIIDAEGKKKGKKIFPTDSAHIYDEYFVLHPILHPSVMLRKSLLPSKQIIYENKWGINDDYYTFFKLLQYGKFYNLKESLLYYRVHGANSSLQNPKQKFMNSIKIRIEAVRTLNYRPSLKGISLMCIQLMTIPLIPEKLIVPLYFALRGIKHPTPTFTSRVFETIFAARNVTLSSILNLFPMKSATLGAFILMLKGLQK